MATESRAETISMTVSVTGGGSLILDALGDTLAGPTTYTVGPVTLAILNGFLTTQGSEYQFTTLGGSSNFPGTPPPANLVVTGEIHSVATGGTNAGLTITETEGAFTNPPPGTTATLLSSSTGNFTNQPTGGGHTASSSVNAIVTPTYSVLSSGTNPNPAGGTASTLIPSVPTLYTFDNVITFGLAHPGAGAPDIVDSFGVTATLSSVPEPVSVVTMLMGTPLPLIVLWLMRRRRALA